MECGADSIRLAPFRPGDAGPNGTDATGMTMWRFLKGDDGLHETALKRIFGSPDLYNPQYRGGGKCFRQFSDLS